VESKYYDLAPRDPKENLSWRIRCRERAMEDMLFRHALYQACMDDLLFFMAFSCWGYDPRAKVKIAPFIPHPHQESVFLGIDRAIDDAETNQKALTVILDKARAQGGTFGYLWIDLRRWLRDPMFSAGYVTRNEDLVDSRTDSNTVLWKIQWALDMLPFFLRPAYDRNLGQHTFINKENSALLRGYAAGQDVAAGGRSTVFTCDEFGAKDFIAGGKDEDVMSALHDVSNCIRLVSARYADSGVFHEACEDKDTRESGYYFILDWKDNPLHGKLSYIVTNNHPKALKPEDQEAVDAYHKEHTHLSGRLERKGFKWEGVTRSPWYDMRCLRPTATPRLIASQLDRNPRGAVGKVFTSDLLDRMDRDHCKKPIWRGTPVFDSETLKLTGLIPRDDGLLKLWFKPGIDNSTPLGPFTVGCDMASGSDGAYSSNSVASGLDNRTGEQVMEYTVKGMPLIKFARITVGLCMWLRNAMLGWEDSGMATMFAKEITEIIYYGNVWYRPVTQIGSSAKSRKAGWACRSADKAEIFEKMALAMETGAYTPRSSAMIKECGEYEWEKGKIIHSPTKNRGGTEENHGDRCIAASGVWYIFSNENVNKVDKTKETSQIPEYGSFLWREQRELMQIKSGSPEFGIRDVVGH